MSREEQLARLSQQSMDNLSTDIDPKYLLQWQVHTPRLLNEVLTNPSTGILHRPIQIFANVLDELATRCSQLNDPILNDLMCRLALYDIADPYSPNYDPDVLIKIKDLAHQTKKSVD